jgi:uncharacterized protein (DUF2236 family)
MALHAAGPRALLLQFAHPMVAQGVADHSNFRRDLWGRTIRTFDTVYDLVFGSRDVALKAARRIHRVHCHVRGTLPFDVGRHRAGTRYAANSIDLLAWVWATLYDSGSYAYERFVTPYVRDERERMYREMRVQGELFGVPESYWPETADGFAAWMDRKIASDEIVVSPTGAELGRIFLNGETGPKSLSRLFKLLACGTLPEKLRRQFSLPWDFATRAKFRAVAASIRVGVKVAPRPLRTVPKAMSAELRWRVGSLLNA